MTGKRFSAPLLGTLLSLSAMGQGQTVVTNPPTSPTLTVSGRGEAAAAPDLAVIRLGTAVQDEVASSAQAQVNAIMTRALTDIVALGVPKEQIRTAGISLTPVYSDHVRANKKEMAVPEVIGFRASNTIVARVEDLTKVGGVIDAGVAAGANQIEGISFELKNDGERRKQYLSALQAAAAEAKAKAEVIAMTMGVKLDGVREVTEGGVEVIQPRVQYASKGGHAMMAQDSGTPIEPGQVRLNATVAVQYAISDGAPR